MDIESDSLRVQQVADELGVSVQTVRRLAKAGKLEGHLTEGGHRRFRRDDVLRYKQEIELARLERGARAARFFSSEPRPQHEISVTVPQPSTTIDEWISENPHADEQLLRDLYPTARRQAEGFAYVGKHLDIANISRLAQQIASVTSTPGLTDSIGRIASQLREAKDSYNNTVESMAQAVLSIHDAMSPQVELHQNLMTSLGQALMPVIEARKQQQEWVARIVESLQPALKSVSLLTSGLLEQVREYLKIDEATTEAFQASGWPIAPSMPRELRLAVLDFHQRGNKRGVSLAILGYYRRENSAALEQTVEGWVTRPYFTERMAIIKDALWAHKERKYTLSVPAAVAQIEGILADFVADPKLYGRPKDLSKQFVDDLEGYGFLQRGIATTLLDSLVMNEYSKIDFPTERRRRPHRRPFNRHGVFHGFSTGYATESYSLRCFLILDAISLLIQIKMQNDGNEKVA